MQQPEPATAQPKAKPRRPKGSKNAVDVVVVERSHCPKCGSGRRSEYWGRVVSKCSGLRHALRSHHPPPVPLPGLRASADRQRILITTLVHLAAICGVAWMDPRAIHFLCAAKNVSRPRQYLISALRGQRRRPQTSHALPISLTRHFSPPETENTWQLPSLTSPSSSGTGMVSPLPNAFLVSIQHQFGPSAPRCLSRARGPPASLLQPMVDSGEALLSVLQRSRPDRFPEEHQ